MIPLSHLPINCVRRAPPLAAAIGRWSHRNNISTSAAKSMLGLADQQVLSVRQLRQAYFELAKQCHPDVASRTQLDFREITEAYEHLLNRGGFCDEADLANAVTADEEDEYRRACDAVLNLPAEVVEECKQNPLFRRWLGGNTDGAQYWRIFFAGHGGLAQKLRPPAGLLGEERQDGTGKRLATRRKRTRR